MKLNLKRYGKWESRTRYLTAGDKSLEFILFANGIADFVQVHINYPSGRKEMLTSRCSPRQHYGSGGDNRAVVAIVIILAICCICCSCCYCYRKRAKNAEMGEI